MDQPGWWHLGDRLMTRRRFLVGTGSVSLAALLAACGRDQPATGPTPTGGATTPATEAEFLVAFAHVGPVSDQGWTWTHDQGRLAVEDKFPNVRTVTVENVPYSEEATITFQQFIDQGAKFVISSADYLDFLYPVVDANPDVPFLELGATRSTANLVPYYVKIWEPSFLVGMAAGLLTKTNRLGFVGAFPIPRVMATLNTFAMGARSVNPNAVCNVVMINSWFDPGKARQAAQALVDGGVDFLNGIMDEPAYLQVAEERGVWAAMENTDMRTFGPNAYVTSILFDWREFYVNEVQSVLDGTWQGDRPVVLLPLGGGTDLDPWGQNVPDSVGTEVDSAREEMLNGELTPFQGPLKDASGNERLGAGEPLSEIFMYSQWDWPVEGVVGL
jgi:basic membrane protein A